MRLDATKFKEKGCFGSSYPTPCFTFPIHIKTLDYEFVSEVLLDTRASTCFMDKDFAIKHSLEHIGKVHPTISFNVPQILWYLVFSWFELHNL